MAGERESGVQPVGQPVDLPRAEIARGCHDLITQAAIVAMNLEFLYQCLEGERRAAVDDVRVAMQRITEIARTLQCLVETASPAVPSAKGRTHTG